MLTGGNVKVENAITLKCGDPNCKGHGKYKP